jgi:ABC-type nickel/cobalt efflux system permease component RcnA
MYRLLRTPQGRSGQVQKISPPQGFDHRKVQYVASRYNDSAIPAQKHTHTHKHTHTQTHTHTNTHTQTHTHTNTHKHTHTHAYIQTYIHKLTNDVNFLPLCLQYYKLAGNCCLVTLLLDLLECRAKFVVLNVCRNMM